jgi:anti-anti-sigma factor
MPVMNVTLGDLNYTLGVGQDNTFLNFAGNLCGSNATKMAKVFQRTVTHAQGKLFLSLQGCYNIDSQALAALAFHHKIMIEHCRQVILVDVPSQILQALEISQLASLFEIFPSLEDAEKIHGHTAV